MPFAPAGRPVSVDSGLRSPLRVTRKALIVPLPPFRVYPGVRGPARVLRIAELFCSRRPTDQLALETSCGSLGPGSSVEPRKPRENLRSGF